MVNLTNALVASIILVGPAAVPQTTVTDIVRDKDCSATYHFAIIVDQGESPHSS